MATAFQVRAYDWQWKNEFGFGLWLAVIGSAASARCWDRRLAFAQNVRRTLQSCAPGMEYEEFLSACEDWLWHPTLVGAAVGLWRVMKDLGDTPVELRDGREE